MGGCLAPSCVRTQVVCLAYAYPVAPWGMRARTLARWRVGAARVGWRCAGWRSAAWRGGGFWPGSSGAARTSPVHAAPPPPRPRAARAAHRLSPSSGNRRRRCAPNEFISTGNLHRKGCCATRLSLCAMHVHMSIRSRRGMYSLGCAPRRARRRARRARRPEAAGSGTRRARRAEKPRR